MDQRNVCKKIDEIIKNLIDLKSYINTTEDQEVKTASIDVPKVDDLNSFESLKSVLLSDKWPVAVNPNLICDPNSDSDKKERGIGILELVIEEPIKGGKFLDFGCGEGQCALQAVEILGCDLSVGYDIKQHDWKDTENTKFKTSYEEVASLGPYDAILLFDVLDHTIGEYPENLLKKASDILSPNGRIYVRCHPWMSKHGTHLYQKLNKAYVHLVFTEEELSKLSDYVPERNIKVTRPIATYNGFFQTTNLKVLSNRNITEIVDTFFRIPKIAERIISNTKFTEFPEFQMGIQFMDFILIKNT